MSTNIEAAGIEDGCWVFAGNEGTIALIGILSRRIAGIVVNGIRAAVVHADEPKIVGAACAKVETADRRDVPIVFTVGEAATVAEWYRATLSGFKNLEGQSHRLVGWDAACLMDPGTSDFDGAWLCPDSPNRLTFRIVGGQVTEISADDGALHVTKSVGWDSIGVCVEFTASDKDYGLAILIGSGAAEREAILVAKVDGHFVPASTRVKRIHGIGQN